MVISSSSKERPITKFMKPWKGPYKIVKVLSDVNYRIKLRDLAQGKPKWST